MVQFSPLMQAVNVSYDFVIVASLIVIIGIIVLFKTVLVNQYDSFKREHAVVHYTIKRIIESVITLVIVVSIVFLMLRMLPKRDLVNDDILTKLKSDSERKTYIESTYRYYGVDKPIYQQLYEYIKSIIPFPKTVCIQTESNMSTTDIIFDVITNKQVTYGQFYCKKSNFTFVDFKLSQKLSVNASVWGEIVNVLPTSARLLLPVVVLEMIIGYVLGILMARNKGKAIDNAGLLYVYVAEALPYIVYLSLMMLLFRNVFAMDYAYSSISPMSIAPAWITLLIVSVPVDAGFARRYTVDEMNADYVKFARSKGLSENRIFFTHIMRNISVMLFRGIPVAVGTALMGAYFLESMFSVPGIGDLLINGIQRHDHNIVQGLTLIFSVITIVSYLLSDLISIALDPRTSLIKNT